MYDNEYNYNSSVKFYLILNNDEVIMYIDLLKRFVIKKILEFDYEILKKKEKFNSWFFLMSLKLEKVLWNLLQKENFHPESK